MFDLGPSKDSNDESTEEYGNSLDSTEPFKDLVKEVSDDIKDTSDTGAALEAVVEEVEEVVEVENPHDIVMDVMAQSERHTSTHYLHCYQIFSLPKS